jgi:flagellar basal-body rod protein FlgC
MNLFGILEISNSALQAQRQRAEIAASNLANAETTRVSGGGPYRRQSVVFGSQPVREFGSIFRALWRKGARGVAVENVVEDTTPPIRRYEPGHPDADPQGYVAFPAVNPFEEVANLMGAARSYQLNAAAVKATKLMIEQSLEILK